MTSASIGIIVMLDYHIVSGRLSGNGSLKQADDCILHSGEMA